MEMRARETTTAGPDCNGYFPLFDYFSDQTDSVKLGQALLILRHYSTCKPAKPCLAYLLPCP
ncbi:MAG: hypothetical protein CMO75_07105 [Verrucomicrobiales bacterium]|nr:hypothetical protein [Verrucomicrobiales bacterium]